jgi:murein DD-endopeptidase MepM/ murein hydrolase activator NlpD
MRNRLLVASLLLLPLLVLVFALFFKHQPAPVPEVPRGLAEEIPAPPPIETDEFGLAIGSFETAEHRIRRNDTFSSILSTYNVPVQTIAQLANESKPVFDVRRIQAGKTYRVYQDDSLQTARLLVYQQDPIRYVVFDLRDSIRVYEGARSISVRQRTAEGTIYSSLYGTLSEQDASPALAAALAEVFAWQIDFYRIQKGDHFKVLYEEQLIDDQPVGIGRIIAARFDHAGEEFFAFHFERGEVKDYFDEEGQSLRKAFLKAPLKFSRISSRYSLRRFHPVQKRYKAHLGTDYAAATGTPIMATGDGVVLEARYTRNNGNYVKLRHNNTYTTGYLHMSRIGNGIRPGRRVRQGEVIGYVGSTGLATGPHLCFRMYKNGAPVNPNRVKVAAAPPVGKENLADFKTHTSTLLSRLQSPETPQAGLAVDPARPGEE